MKPSSQLELTAWQTYENAVSATHSLIDPEHDRSPTLALVRTRAETRMQRVRRLLAALGNPQDQIPLVHVAGTSGKGSTATAIASMLIEGGYRTGLHTSPYLQVATEKLQIDRKLISAHDFAAGVDRIIDIAEEVLGSEEERLSYGELWVCLTFSWFAANEVDIGVVEVGAGGRFDLTNVFTPVVSVITPIGIDHVETLGETLAKIAWHKAGIIKPSVPVAISSQLPEAEEIIRQEAFSKHAPVDVADPGAPALTSLRLINPELGAFEMDNCATAMTAIGFLGKQGFPVDEEMKVHGLTLARIPGRLEHMPDQLRILLDGAHNPQKMNALVRSLSTALPTKPGGKRILLFGALKAKDLTTMVEVLAPEVDVVICTEPGVYSKLAAKASAVAEAFRTAGFKGDIFSEPRPIRALQQARLLFRDPQVDALLVTGSMYLVGNIRGAWYPEKQILAQATSWPE